MLGGPSPCAMDMSDDSNDPWQPVRAFVALRMDADAFEAVLYRDAALAAALEAARPLPAWLPLPDLYSWACSLDLARADDLLNLRSVLAQVLPGGEGEVEVDQAARKAADARDRALRSAQPRWLSLDEGYLAHWLAGHGEDAPDVLRAALQAHIRAHFLSVKRPPRWLQEAAWPIEQGRPLRFIGQLPLGDHAHDDAFVYVFQRGDGSCWTIVQHA